MTPDATSLELAVAAFTKSLRDGGYYAMTMGNVTGRVMFDAMEAALRATPASAATISAVESEREECAKVAEEAELLWDVEWLLTATKKDCSQRAAREIAAAIRARSKPATGEKG